MFIIYVQIYDTVNRQQLKHVSKLVTHILLSINFAFVKRLYRTALVVAPLGCDTRSVRSGELWGFHNHATPTILEDTQSWEVQNPGNYA
jgi:hypothetical protein